MQGHVAAERRAHEGRSSSSSASLNSTMNSE
jgi:hypothetical protein